MKDNKVTIENTITCQVGFAPKRDAMQAPIDPKEKQITAIPVVNISRIKNTKATISQICHQVIYYCFKLFRFINIVIKNQLPKRIADFNFGMKPSASPQAPYLS